MNKQEIKENLKKGLQRKSKESFSLLAELTLKSLPDRSAEIVKKRFGLSNGKKKTLEEIGNEYRITRERVRQIIFQSFKNISLKNDEIIHFLKAKKKILFTINQNNGIIKKKDTQKIFGVREEKEVNSISFFISCFEEILEGGKKGILEKAWFSSKEKFFQATEIVKQGEKILEEEKRVLSDKLIFEKIFQSFPNFSQSQLNSFLNLAVKIKKNPFGKWGIINWLEINPKGTRERVYLVLKESQKPMHFRQIAQLIDKYKLGKRKAHPQTVHNELIKDNRFVLIGRGIYALREWGYFKGTTKEVLKRILAKNKKPLEKDKILQEILKVRKVKKTTIMINLNDRQVFQKKGEFYQLKK